MSDAYMLPLPMLDDLNRPFWTAGADGLLRFQHCQDCAYWLHPPGEICPRCLGKAIVFEAVGGQGTIEALSINYQSWMPGLQVPYALAIVGIDEQEGLRLTTRIVDAPLQMLRIGQRVHVVFEPREDVWLPLFTPL